MIGEEWQAIDKARQVLTLRERATTICDQNYQISPIKIADTQSVAAPA